MSESQKPTTDAYRENWDRLWGAKKSKKMFIGIDTSFGTVVADERVPKDEIRLGSWDGPSS